MHLSISAQFKLENSAGHKGLVSERIAWAKKKPLSLFEMGRAVLGEIFDWYLHFTDVETLNQDKEKLVAWLQACQFSIEVLPTRPPRAAP